MDLDQQRQAVGDEKLSYYGLSYGTLLGAVYVNLFPNKVGPLILDGNVDPVMYFFKGGLPATVQVRGTRDSSLCYVLIRLLPFHISWPHTYTFSPVRLTVTLSCPYAVQHAQRVSSDNGIAIAFDEFLWRCGTSDPTAGGCEFSGGSYDQVASHV